MNIVCINVKDKITIKIGIEMFKNEDVELLKDTGRIRMMKYKDVLYCEAYLNDELTIDDVESVAIEVCRNYNGRCDVIFNKAGSYSVSKDAQISLERGRDELGKFVYVVDNESKRLSAEYAAKTYMRPYAAEIASSAEEAYLLLAAAR